MTTKQLVKDEIPSVKDYLCWLVCILEVLFDLDEAFKHPDFEHEVSRKDAERCNGKNQHLKFEFDDDGAPTSVIISIPKMKLRIKR